MQHQRATSRVSPTNSEKLSDTLKLNSKWFSTVASIWIQCTSGSLYTFSIYNQSTLDTVSVFKDIGATCGVLSGVLYTSATSWNQTRVRGGPWVVLLAGAIQCFAGSFSTGAAVTGLIPRPPSFFNTAGVVTSVRNFRHFSGTSVGIMKSSIFLLVFGYCLTRTNPLSLMWWFVRIYEVDEGDIEKKYLDSLSLIVAAYLMSVIALEDLFASRKSSRVMDESRLLVREDRFAYRRLPNDNEVDLDTNEQEQNLLQAVRTVDFWILLLAMACGMGSGLARI
ncbi:hypothetical protein NC653_029323 [Populus alba x Populus x berolinensis]|nr:hypothetical protein NC653_029323 [Populus alba x Populus x berolinensis]